MNSNVQSSDLDRRDAERFRVLAELSPDCIKIFDADYKIDFMNRGGLEEHGFARMEDAVGLDWTDTVVPEQRSKIAQKMQEGIKEKKTVTFDVQHLPQFSNRGWCSMVVSPVFDRSGDFQYFIGISRDITDRKRSEDEMVKRMKDIEKLNALMIGRELKMIELKRENMKLRAEKAENI